MKPKITLLVTDLDNTLWDWFEIWYNSFSSMLQTVIDLTGLDQGKLEAEIRAVHQARGTAEYTYLLNELPSLQALYPGEDVATRLDDAIYAYRSARKASSRLYPSVMETLQTIRSKGTTVAAYTESLGFVSSQRLRHFGLDGVIQYLFSPADHEFPPGVTPAMLRTGPDSEYELRFTATRHTPPGLLKPCPVVLDTIVREFGTSPDATVYVGDSLMKDVLMAQQVGVHDVLAEYGAVQHRPEYELLRRVSHWSDADVMREKATMTAAPTNPSFRLNQQFGEILDLFEFSTP